MGTRACTWPACPGAPVASTCSHLQPTSSHFRETKSRPCSFADAVPSSQSAFPSCHCRPSSSNWGSCLSVLQPRAPPMGALSEGKSRPPMATHPASHKGANTQGAEAPGCSRDPRDAAEAPGWSRGPRCSRGPPDAAEAPGCSRGPGMQQRPRMQQRPQIGRASCRERVSSPV